MIETHAHDNEDCVDRVVGEAVSLCAEKGVRLTEQRKSVLKVLASSHVPASAYDILNQLNRERKEQGESMLAPVSVYRALDFLIQHGIIHRIESRNAYIACSESHTPHGEATIFLLCEKCGRADEFQSESLGGMIEAIASAASFKPNEPVMEIRGLCADCRKIEDESRKSVEN
ncbi:Fur family transcriptional regulator [uncultured Cohaesibacter sp.]|uniref:Fur family transcriptional regulator n=1 Tax=uncultured Cohaesibacter sp. TaxID=1002546 RepID=UPI00292EBCD8|nr:Fur family transcriptional regulator [uncultured Cohaesibacter sp.]